MNNSKLTKGVAVVMLAGLLAPSVLFAQGVSGGQTDTRRAAVGAQACAALSERTAQFSKKMAERKAKVAEQRAKTASSIGTKQGNGSGALDSNRSDWDANHAKQYAALDARATTDAQKAAVASFKTTMDAAVTTRRSAIDGAVSTFRTGLSSLVTSRQSSADTAMATYETAVNAAIAKANTDCTAGVDGKTVRDTLTTSIKAARDAFQASRKPDTDLSGTGAQALNAARKASVDKAVADFRATAEAARATLKTAFGTAA